MSSLIMTIDTCGRVGKPLLESVDTSQKTKRPCIELSRPPALMIFSAPHIDALMGWWEWGKCVYHFSPLTVIRADESLVKFLI